MKKFNLMQIVPSLQSGGVEQGTIDVANYLASLKIQNNISSNGGKMVSYLDNKFVRHNLIPVNSKNFFLMPFVANKINRIINKESINILHFRSRAPAWLLPYINKKNLKTVSTFHNIYGNENIFKKFYNKQLSRVNEIIAISDYVKKEIIKIYNIKPEKITVINRGIDTNFFDSTNYNENLYRIMGDRLEMRYQDGDNVALYDIQGWYGNDYNKAWIKAEGEYNTSENEHEQTSLEALYSRNIASFWDVQAGLRHDFINDEDDRNFAAFGVQGLAPYWFEVEATSYLSDEGDVSAVLEAEYDLLLSQRFIIQPRFETEVSLNDVPEYNIGSGITGFETGIRARYEFSRKFAPYIGVSWEQAVGETADLMQADGEDTSKTFMVGGIKFWF